MAKRKSSKLPFEATQAAIARENRITFQSAGAKRQRSPDLIPDTIDPAIVSRAFLDRTAEEAGL